MLSVTLSLLFDLARLPVGLVELMSSFVVAALGRDSGAVADDGAGIDELDYRAEGLRRRRYRHAARPADRMDRVPGSGTSAT